MSETNFVIQVRINQKWSTAHGLSSEQSLRKFLPRLTAEHGEAVRALRASRDVDTGETKWYIYKYSEARRPQELPSRRARSRPRTGDEPAARGIPETIERSVVHVPNSMNDNAEAPYGDEAYQEPAVPAEKVNPWPDRFRRVAAFGVAVGRWIVATLIRAATATYRGFKAWILVPLANGFMRVVRLCRQLIAIENKIEKIQTYFQGALSAVDLFFRRADAQWALCLIFTIAGLAIAFMASFPGGVTLAVLGGYFIPPVRQYILAKQDRNPSPLMKSVFAFALLVASGIMDFGNPGNRHLNANVFYFKDHREEILNQAQSSLDRGDYVGVVSLLRRFLPARDEHVNTMYVAARAPADAELTRQKKIAAQFSFNGSNKHLTDYIIRSMSDPGSYTHIKTTYKVHKEYVEVQTTYRGLNELGVLFTRTVNAFINFDGMIIHQR